MITTPTEPVRIANLPHHYHAMVRGIKHDDHFLYECVNMGVPLRILQEGNISLATILSAT